MKQTATSNRVTDVHGDQILVDGRWYHAARVFGQPASTFVVGQEVEQLAAASSPKRSRDPDEFVGSDLFRGCSANEMCREKVQRFAQAMIEHGGWGAFPNVSGYVETLSAAQVEECQRLVGEGREDVWTTEMGWSRLVSDADVGKRYVHIDNGHHRVTAAALASAHVGTIQVPVADRHTEEATGRFA